MRICSALMCISSGVAITTSSTDLSTPKLSYDHERTLRKNLPEVMPWFALGILQVGHSQLSSSSSSCIHVARRRPRLAAPPQGLPSWSFTLLNDTASSRYMLAPELDESFQFLATMPFECSFCSVFHLHHRAATLEDSKWSTNCMHFHLRWNPRKPKAHYLCPSMHRNFEKNTKHENLMEEAHNHFRKPDKLDKCFQVTIPATLA